MSVHFSSDDHTWETPQDLFDSLNSLFSFTWDAAATSVTTKCGRNYYGPDQYTPDFTDALSVKWDSRHQYWMNPPYGREIGKFMRKASGSNCDVVCLVPARTDTKWWYYSVHCLAAEIYFIHGRLRFGDSKNSAPFPSAIVVYYSEKDMEPPAYGMMSPTGVPI